LAEKCLKHDGGCVHLEKIVFIERIDGAHETLVNTYLKEGWTVYFFSIDSKREKKI